VAVDVSIPKKLEQNDVALFSLRIETILATLHFSPGNAGEAATSGRPNTRTLAICIEASVVGKSPSFVFVEADRSWRGRATVIRSIRAPVPVVAPFFSPFLCAIAGVERRGRCFNFVAVWLQT